MQFLVDRYLYRYYSIQNRLPLNSFIHPIVNSQVSDLYGQSSTSVDIPLHRSTE